MTQRYLSAAAQLLDREVTEECLDQWTELVSAKNQEAETRVGSAVVFRVGEEWLALSTSAFQEVAQWTVVHKLPNRRDGALRGLVNVRGELLLCVSLDLLIGLEQPPDHVHGPQDSTDRRLLVCDHKGSRVAFPVTEVITIHNYFLRDLRHVPVTLGRAAACTMGVLYWRDKIIGCLDIDLLFQALDEHLE